jgi:hypothetical protein
LIRYYNYAKTKAKKFIIVYLTLEEQELKDEVSYNSYEVEITGRNFDYLRMQEYENYKNINKNTHNHFCLYYPITYKNDVINWLEKCIEITNKTPLICETIKQYRNCIKNITNQNINTQMDNDLKKLITNENVKGIRNLNNQIDEIIFSTKNKFNIYFKNKFNNSPFKLPDNTEIRFLYDEDPGGFYIGFQYFKEEVPLNQSIKGIDFTNRLKIEYPFFELANDWFIGWYNPKLFSKNLKFEDLDIQEILKMYENQTHLENIVDDIIIEYAKIRERLIELTQQ